MHSHISKVKAAINDLQKGKMVILTDHPARENEGDIIFPAEIITADIVNFMIRNGGGIVCLSLLPDQLKKLGLNDMVPFSENTNFQQTPFTVSIEAKKGITTGVSAQDRATTILTATKNEANSEDVVKPGHVFPLRAKVGGVLERQGHTEGAIDIVRLAGFKPAAVLCEVMNPDGTMAKGKKLSEFAKQHAIKMLSIDDIIVYRRAKENLILDEIETKLPIEKYGIFTLSVIKEKYTNSEHIVLSKDTLLTPPLLRIHSSCITGDLFGSQRCDCNIQFQYSLEKINQEGGMLIYLNQEGRGVGLFNKIKAYSLQENGLDTIDANRHLGLPIDSREYYLAANVLRNRNIDSIRLLTNNPHKIINLKKYGINDIQREPISIRCNEHNKNYLHTKKIKLNHSINFIN